MYKTILYILFLTLFCNRSNATLVPFKINIGVIYKHQNLPLNKWLPVSNSKDNIQISKFKFYISHFEFIKNGKIIFADHNSVFLYDIENSSSNNINIMVPSSLSFDSLKIQIGIDSVRNASGNMEADLSPLKDMYWTWQSGYINIKLEVKHKSDVEKLIQYHIGGYQSPYASIASVTFPIKERQEIQINYDIESLLNTLDFMQEKSIMSPGIAAVQFTYKFKRGLE